MAGWVAAIAAVVAAAVVCWQSWETRKAAQASRDAVDVANEALALSRRQASEAVRARIDAATPRITVAMPDVPDWPPLEPSLYHSGEPQPLLQGLQPEPMLMPRDKGRRILVRAPVTVINESDAHIRVEVSQLTDDKGQALASPIHLDPHARLSALFAVSHTLEEWIEVHGRRAAGEGSLTSIGHVRYSDPADTGAIDRWELQLFGSPVERAPDIDGAWLLVAGPAGAGGQPGAMALGFVMRERRYYLSKSRNELLPD